MKTPTKPKLGPLANRTEQTPKAQTPKTCRRCERTIEKGERYHLVLGRREWRWKTLVLCLDCYSEISTTPECCTMKNIENLTKEERSLLLFAECACVDYGGIYQPERLNDADKLILNQWKSDGFCDHGRVASDCLTPTRRVWIQLSDEAMNLAHELRCKRAARMWKNRNWITSNEKRFMAS